MTDKHKRYILVGTFEVLPKAREYINHILDSGHISYGSFSRKFENEFAKLHNCKHAILSNSGTSSLLIALQTLKEVHGWQDGDEVIVPAITFVATVNVILQSGLKPVLVDVEKDFYCIDCTLIEQSITKRTKAIIPVHVFGQPCDMRFIKALANYHNLKIIEDSCEAMFVNCYEKPVGSWGDINCFSTYMAHLVTTGVGGISVTNDNEHAKIMRSLINHGMDYSDLSMGNTFNPQKLRRDFIFSRVGHSFRLTELEAAIGIAQLENLEETITIRQENAQYLTDKLPSISLQLPRTRLESDHSFMMYPIVCKRPNLRDYLVDYLEINSIGTRRMLPLTCQPVYKGIFNESDYPVADWINKNGFYIGCHQGLDKDDLDYMVEKIEGGLKSATS